MRYLTKDWYIKCQIYPQTEELRKELDDSVNAYRTASSKEDLPSAMRKCFMFHDGSISKIDVGVDCVIELDSPYSKFRRVIFRNAVVKNELPPVGAEWLYEELYRHKSGVGYEAHILSYKMMKPKHTTVLTSDLFDTKIICEDILFE